jgi:hypothetical protein
VTNVGIDRSQLAHMATETKATLDATSLVGDTLAVAQQLLAAIRLFQQTTETAMFCAFTLQCRRNR